MKSNYKKLGEFIREVSIKNKDLTVELLLGVSIRKQFFPSIANTVGTDMSKYKIVKRNQFAYGSVTSRNGEKISVALLAEDECLVSTSYTVFEVIDKEVLDPEYLMMWFRRSEFDRYARYMSHGTVRELFGWEDMCDVELPVPSIEKQREIVREYNTVNNRIELNDKIRSKIEDAAQSIYKQWFVDFEFPISRDYAQSIGRLDLEGLPYKSSGGEMEYCDSLDVEIPSQWKWGCFRDVANQFSGYSFKGDDYSFEKGITVIRGENVTEGKLRFDTHKKWSLSLPNRAKNCFLKSKDIVIGMDGSKVGKNWSLVSPYQLPLLLAQRVCCIRADSLDYQLWLYISLKVHNFSEYVNQVQTGTSVPHISGEQIMDFGIYIPNDYSLISKFDIYAERLFNEFFIKQEESLHLNELRKILLQNMARV